MNEQNTENVKTLPGQSFEFGEFVPPSFEVNPKASVNQSVVASFEFVRPLMSNKPLRRAKGSIRHRVMCPVYLIPESDGGYSVISANLPGVASQGESVEEALANVREAFEAAIQSYRAAGMSIPWLSEPEEPEPGSIPRSVAIYV